MQVRHIASLLVGLLTLVAVPRQIRAQDDSAEVLRTVQRFFDSMAARDTAEARRILILDATYFSVRATEEGRRVRQSTNRVYLEGLASGTDLWQERMWDPQVMVHGGIAVVWTPYDFHRNGEFSHCGVDAFSLIRTDEGWKIAGIIYTVENAECHE